MSNNLNGLQFGTRDGILDGVTDGAGNGWYPPIEPVSPRVYHKYFKDCKCPKNEDNVDTVEQPKEDESVVTENEHNADNVEPTVPEDPDPVEQPKEDESVLSETEEDDPKAE